LITFFAEIHKLFEVVDVNVNNNNTGSSEQ
jgi:hypothetical protein